MIDVAHLTKTYGEFTAVNDFSFRQARRIVGLIGPNGAGKATLRSIAGIHAPPPAPSPSPATASSRTVEASGGWPSSPTSRSCSDTSPSPNICSWCRGSIKSPTGNRARRCCRPSSNCSARKLARRIVAWHEAKVNRLRIDPRTHGAVVRRPLTGLDPLGIRKMKQICRSRQERRRYRRLVAPAAGRRNLHAHRDHRSRREGRRWDDGGAAGARGRGRRGHVGSNRSSSRSPTGILMNSGR